MSNALSITVTALFVLVLAIFIFFSNQSVTKTYREGIEGTSTSTPCTSGVINQLKCWQYTQNP